MSKVISSLIQENYKYRNSTITALLVKWFLTCFQHINAVGTKINKKLLRTITQINNSKNDLI
jgi:hypothetical protein